MKHLEDLQSDMQMSKSTGVPHFVDTRMEGIVPEEIHHPEFHVREKPKDPPFKRPTLGSAKTFLLLALLFFVGALGYFGYVFGRGAGSVSEENITLEIIGSSFVTSGSETEYELVIENKNTSPIEEVFAVLEVPTASGGAPQTVRTSLGSIDARAQERTKFPVTLFGAQYDDRELRALIEFSFPGSRATLKRIATLPVRIAESPVILQVTAPDRLVVGQETSVEVTIATQSLLTGVGLRMEYPEGFEVTSTSYDPAAGNYFWEFSRLPANRETKLVIKGVFRGLPIEGATNSFRASVGSLSRDERILSNIYATRSREVTVGQAGLTALLFAGSSSDDRVALFPGSDLSGYILVTNTTNTPVRNASVTMSVTGDGFDLSKARVGAGFIDSANRQIVWNSQLGIVDLALVAPGQTVQLEYSIGTKSTWKSGAVPGTLSVSVQGQLPSGELMAARNIDSLEIVESAKLGLLQKTLYVDGPFQNTGPNPPRVGQATTFTVVWVLPRQIVDFDDVRVVGTLPVYVEWLDIKDPASSPLTYDSATRKITWEQGTVLSSMASDPTISFQVRVTPSVTHKQTTPAIINNVELSGRNKLTNERFSAGKADHTTRTRGDSVSTNGSVEE